MAIGVGGEPRYHTASGGTGLPGSGARSAGTDPGRAASADARVLRKTLALLEPQSERFMAHFSATLFVRNPELRPMFPLTLGESRKQVFGALTRCAWSLDQPEPLARWLGELGRDHRKFGVTGQHYQLFCDALLTTVQAFCAGAWSEQVRAVWDRGLATVTTAMTAGAGGADAATGGAAGEPAWWLAEVAEHDLRCPGLAVLALRPDRSAMRPVPAG